MGRSVLGQNLPKMPGKQLLYGKHTRSYSSSSTNKAFDCNTSSKRVQQSIDCNTSSKRVQQSVDCNTSSKKVQQSIDCNTSPKRVQRSIDCNTSSKKVQRSIDCNTSPKKVHQSIDCNTSSKKVQQSTGTNLSCNVLHLHLERRHCSEWRQEKGRHTANTNTIRSVQYKLYWCTRQGRTTWQPQPPTVSGVQHEKRRYTCVSMKRLRGSCSSLSSCCCCRWTLNTARGLLDILKNVPLIVWTT